MRQIVMAVLVFGMLGEALASDPYVGVDRVVLGTQHACALAAGRVACWGDNEYGQLGNGTRAFATVAADVLGLPAPVTALAAGGPRTCAVAAGATYCWGLGFPGDDGPTLEQTYPVRVSGLDPGVVGLVVGDGHACVLMATNGVKCWGLNLDGQLGIGSTTEPYSGAPRDVVGLASGVVRISAGAAHTCAVMTGGTVRCWGAGTYGQLGDGGLANAASPVEVSGLTVSDLDAGDKHTCAVTPAGVAKCWGANFYHQLGDGTTLMRATPVDVTGLVKPAVSISAGGSHSCARDQDGNALCWGSNELGQIGNGVLAGPGAVTPSPTPVLGLGPAVVAVEAGFYRSCAIEAATRALECWGDNVFGSVGNGTSSYAIRALEAKTSAASVALAAGGGSTCTFVPKIPIPQCYAGLHAHGCAIDAAGGVACWGWNEAGQLGNGTHVRALVPTPVSSLSAEMVAVSTGAAHSCALSAAGALKCWGSNTHGQLGDGSNVASSVPVDVVGLGTGVVAVSAGPAHTCALTGGGAVLCWGANESGQLGDNALANASIPRQVVGLASGVSTISTGGATPTSAPGGGFSCAVTTAGAAKCWGNNQFHQMGGPVASSLVPVDVPTLASGAIGISAGGAHACAVLAGGGVKCWGLNRDGQLSLPLSGMIYAPTELPAIAPGVHAVAAGGLHTCAETTAGVVHCWGRIGRGLGSDPTVIAQVPGLSAPQSGLVSGSAHSCAIGQDQRARCWGENAQGQLGNGGAAIFASAVQVIATHACGGFDDLAAAHPFCSSVTWLVNRVITLGCAEDSYCPSSSVSRLSMAAFMERLGRSLGPEGASDQREITDIAVYSTYGICGAQLPPAGDQPRSIQLDAVVSAFADADSELVTAFGITVPGFTYITSPSAPLSLRAGRWTQVRVIGSRDLEQTASYVQVVLSNPLADPAIVARISCNLRLRLENRNELPAP